MGVALVLGLVVAGVYMMTGRYTKNFAITLVLLPVLVQIVLLCVNGNLGTSVAVLGTFGLIRFRSIPGTSKEITSIFFAMAIGVACAMGQVAFAGIFTLLIAVILLVLSKSKFGDRKPTDKCLQITIPENLDYTGIFSDVFSKYTSRCDLQQVKTVNLGSMYLLTYDITLKNAAEEKAMIDEIRTRNGNLNVFCGLAPEKFQEL